MSKRQAEIPLDENYPGSPASKKARVEDDAEFPNGSAPAQQTDDRALGTDKRNGADISTTTELEDQGLQDGAQDIPESSDFDEEISALSAPKRQTQPMEGYDDLYLDTVNRGVLDFDFEKLCSVSLSNINVYACLVCGKYFQGRGPKSHAYFHSLEDNHHVYINMGTKKVYVLPEGYEVQNKSLEDIKYVVDPVFTKSEVAKLDKEVHDAWDLSGSRYRPGKTPPLSLMRPLRILIFAQDSLV
jgi:U4/U6.U5 tri-snRNP-associated protein 2